MAAGKAGWRGLNTDRISDLFQFCRFFGVGPNSLAGTFSTIEVGPAGQSPREPVLKMRGYALKATMSGPVAQIDVPLTIIPPRSFFPKFSPTCSQVPWLGSQ
jgi:hypothetical protein